MDTEDIREAAGLWAAYYATDEARRDPDSGMAARRRAQQMAVAEILRFIEGHPEQAVDELRERGYVPLTLADLPKRVGGTAPD